MIVYKFRKLLALILVIFLSGCVSNSVKTQKIDRAELKRQWLEQQDRLKEVARWELNGKAYLSTEQGSGVVRLDWAHSQNEDVLKLTAPLGVYTLDIHSNKKGAFVSDSKGRQYSAATLRGLVWLKTGFDVPFEQLKSWLLGIAPDPDASTLLISQQANTKGFSLGEWKVFYDSYQVANVSGDKLPLPKKMSLTQVNRSEKSVGLVKLAIKNWHVQ